MPVGDLPAEVLAALSEAVFPGMSPAALAALSKHHWPGNVRELKSAVERAAVLATGDEIEPADFDLAPTKSAPATIGTDVPFAEAKKRAIAHFERSYIAQALSENEGNISRTAAAIGMVRQSLQQKIRELGLRKDGE